VRSPQAAELTAVLSASGGTVSTATDGALLVSGVPAPRIGELAAQDRIVLHELTPVAGSLEQAYMELTQGETEYVSGGAPGAPPPPPPTGAPISTGGPR
jgi:ABC-2 type transport system ATP-binding protein